MVLVVLSIEIITMLLADRLLLLLLLLLKLLLLLLLLLMVVRSVACARIAGGRGPLLCVVVATMSQSADVRDPAYDRFSWCTTRWLPPVAVEEISLHRLRQI